MSPPGPRLLIALAALAVTALARSAAAQLSPAAVSPAVPLVAPSLPRIGDTLPQVPVAPVQWDPVWPVFRTGEYIATGVGISVLLASRLWPQRSAHWRGGFLLDEPVRKALRLHTPSARRWARDGSDIGIVVNESWPFFDAMVVAGWYRQSPEVGVQQALISAEVLAVTAGVQGLVSSLASRERPYGRECGGELSAQTRDCVTRDRYYSFYSGHSSQSFAAAAVHCMHHAYVPLYGGGAADAGACAGAFGVAITTALLRVATDVHYLSDVLMGAAIGTTTGLMLPWALHYRFGAGNVGSETGRTSTPPGEPSTRLSLVPSLGPGYGGVQGVLIF